MTKEQLSTILEGFVEAKKGRQAITTEKATYNLAYSTGYLSVMKMDDDCQLLHYFTDLKELTEITDQIISDLL